MLDDERLRVPTHNTPDCSRFQLPHGHRFGRMAERTRPLMNVDRSLVAASSSSYTAAGNLRSWHCIVAPRISRHAHARAIGRQWQWRCLGVNANFQCHWVPWPQEQCTHCQCTLECHCWHHCIMMPQSGTGTIVEASRRYAIEKNAIANYPLHLKSGNCLRHTLL